MVRKILHFGWAIMLAGCGQSSDSSATSQPSPQPKKKPSYCFFKEDETKSWAAHRDKDMNVVLTGKAHVKDSRYKAVLGEPSLNGTAAEIAPSISQNDAAYGAPDDWWDLSATIAGSANVQNVTVHCGDKLIATLTLPPQN